MCGNELGDTVQCVSVFGNTLFLLEEKIMHKCNQCGHSFEGKFCPECGTPYATAKMEFNNSTHYDSEFEKEKKQCQVLLMLLNNCDLKYLKDQALKVLNLNPTNSLAQMIYECDFKKTIYYDFEFIELNEEPLERYLKKECGNIDAATCSSFMYALIREPEIGSCGKEIVKYAFYNLTRLGLSENQLFNYLKAIAEAISDKSQIHEIAYKATVNYESFRSFDTRSIDLNRLAEDAFESRKKIANTFKSLIEVSPLSDNHKSELIKMLGNLISQPASYNNQSTTYSNDNNPKETQTSSGSRKKVGGFILISLGVVTCCLGFIQWSFFLWGGIMILGGVGCFSKGKNIK